MSEKWGRAGVAGVWPRPALAWTTAALIVAVAWGFAVGVYEYWTAWTPLQRVYLSTYTRSAMLDDLGSRDGKYWLLNVVAPRATRLALDTELEVVRLPSGEDTFELSEQGRLAGGQRLVWKQTTSAHGALHAFLRRGVYRDQELRDLVMPSVWAAVFLGGIGLVIAIPVDLRHARERRHGRRLKGPELISARCFLRRVHADGVGFIQRTGRFGRRQRIAIPRRLESSHLLIMGDSGTGKSALIRQLLTELEQRGDTAIVYDPALEYTSQFYRPERGDIILNPLDARSPYWSPSDEWRHDAETLTLATSLFPDRAHENPFFTEAPRRIFAFLLTLKPTPAELAAWLCEGDELDRRLVGTPYASMVDRQAPAQRGGVLASLNMVADTLKLLPAEHGIAGRWSASEWSNKRTGWLFLTSTPETRQRLVPLTSLWLDTLVLRLMNQGQPHPRSTWFVLDELATLQRLPQLHTAITENRKSNNPVVLGFQGRAQLETRYGHDAEAMLSQPAMKIFLRTSEPHAAKWIAESIGEVEIERLAESRSEGRRGHKSYGLERQVEPLVMASEITGLANLRGYLKTGNLVVRLDLAFQDRPHRHPAFVPRVPAARHSGSHERAARRTESVTALPAPILGHEPPDGARRESALSLD